MARRGGRKRGWRCPTPFKVDLEVIWSVKHTSHPLVAAVLGASRTYARTLPRK
jgi:hypothetical protein